MNEKSKKEIKRDRARLKELKKRDKKDPDSLTEQELWEYTRLLNEDTERTWKQTEKIQKAGFVILGLNILAVLVWVAVRIWIMLH